MIGDRPERQKADRNLAIVEARKAGRTLQEIGREFGISPERVRWILKRQEIMERNERRRETEMEKAKVLKLEEAIRWNRKVIWLETREDAQVLPVTYYAEHMPFLRFDCEDRVAMIEVRAEFYGKTWRCWDRDPAGAQSVKTWKSAGGEDK